jgi:hypothetical protein
MIFNLKFEFRTFDFSPRHLKRTLQTGISNLFLVEDFELEI